MIKLIIFDLDGVLVEAKQIHYDALNEALGEKYSISWDEHLSVYDGLKTNQKLDMLTERKDLPTSSHKQIWDDKQKYTLKALSNLQPSTQLQVCMDILINNGYKLAVCSNSIRKTVLTVLSKFDIIDRFDLIISNEDVKNSKPHPEMYWKAMSMIGCLPEETLIVEDSPYGLLAASRSKANVMRVGSPKEVTYNNIYKHLNKEKTNMTPKWKDEKLETGGREFLTFKQAQDFKKKLQGMTSSVEYKVVKVEYADGGMMAKGGRLSRKQKQLDLNKNGKLDSQDFKMLRAGRKNARKK